MFVSFFSPAYCVLFRIYSKIRILRFRLNVPTNIILRIIVITEERTRSDKNCLFFFVSTTLDYIFHLVKNLWRFVQNNLRFRVYFRVQRRHFTHFLGGFRRMVSALFCALYVELYLFRSNIFFLQRLEIVNFITFSKRTFR